MAINPEIKSFIKNTLILTLFFALVIHFSWGYFMSMAGFSASAQNEKNFEQANIVYLWNIATALSLNLWWANKAPASVENVLNPTVISITEVLQNPTEWQQKLIASNMLAINSYANIIQMNIVEELKRTNDRANVLDRHISLLKSYQLKTQEQLSIIRDQKNDLQSLIQQAEATINNSKSTLEGSFDQLEYNGVDAAIDNFVQARDTHTRARIYMVYLDRFEQSYNALQTKATSLIDTLESNRAAIIQQTKIVIPSSGSDIIKELWLIQSESELKAQKILQ